MGNGLASAAESVDSYPRHPSPLEPEKSLVLTYNWVVLWGWGLLFWLRNCPTSEVVPPIRARSAALDDYHAQLEQELQRLE